MGMRWTDAEPVRPAQLERPHLIEQAETWLLALFLVLFVVGLAGGLS
jgi:hypothetical protein